MERLEKKMKYDKLQKRVNFRIHPKLAHRVKISAAKRNIPLRVWWTRAALLKLAQDKQLYGK